jgi:hypothetical protein
MLHCLRPFLDVKVRSKINFTRREMLEEPVNVSIDLGGDAINFHPVAGREDDDFFKASPQLEAAAVTA